jgi:hypothetical protein
LRSRAWTGLPALALLGVIGLALAGGAGMVDILYDLPSDAPTWKRVGFVDPWSVVLVVLMLVTVASVIGFGRELARRWSTAAPTDLRAEEWAAIDRAGYYRLLRRGTLIVVLLPAAMLTVQWVFEQVMLGRPPVLDRAGAIVEAGAGAVKDWIIDAATWLQDRDVILLAVALAVFGAVIGLGYDKLVASWVNPAARRVRRSIARLGHRGTAEPGLAAAEAAGGSDGSATPLPHPWSRLTAAQRWVLFVSTGVATAALSYALWALPVPDGGIVELELARYPDALAWRGSTATTWSLILDYPYLVAYGVFLSLALAFFASVWNTRARDEHHTSARTTVTDWASRAAWLPLAAAAADSIENAFLLGFLGGRPGWTADTGAAFATLKFFLLGAAALALLAQAAVWAALLVQAAWRKRHVVP